MSLVVNPEKLPKSFKLISRDSNEAGCQTAIDFILNRCLTVMVMVSM